MLSGFRMHGHRRGQVFERGALKYVILDLISKKPRHGYEIIREFEELSGGCYIPSPGTIYPTLQMLEDIGSIRMLRENGKKVYEITDEGKEYLSSHKDKVKHHQKNMSDCFTPGGSRKVGSMMREVKGLFHLIAHTARGGAGEPEKAEEINKVLLKARKDIEAIIGS